VITESWEKRSVLGDGSYQSTNRHFFFSRTPELLWNKFILFTFNTPFSLPSKTLRRRKLKRGEKRITIRKDARTRSSLGREDWALEGILHASWSRLRGVESIRTNILIIPAAKTNGFQGKRGSLRIELVIDLICAGSFETNCFPKRPGSTRQTPSERGGGRKKNETSLI